MTTISKSEDPYYTHPCDSVVEDHARHVVVHQYVACIRIPSEWVVPANNSVVRVSLPAVVDLLIGSRLWNPKYGYFLITSFDAKGQTVTLQREPNALVAGTVVPSCTKFIFTPAEQTYSVFV